VERRGGHDITQLLSRAHAGDPRAAEELLPLVYGELRKLAHARMRQERPGQTLQATGLVHEAYLRLIGDEDVGWDSRGHFFAAAAEAMRRILIERARRKARQRHGGELRRTTFDAGVASFDDADEGLLDLDRALTALQDRDEQMATIVKLRYFAGLGIDEVAAALDISPRTVNRNWLAARTWLRSELETPAS
jgi:RNA polymerase sigma factor (TIGR02999 family)